MAPFVPDIWVVRVGLMSGLVLVSMTLIAYWLVIISRVKSNVAGEGTTEDNLDGIQNPSSPIAIHSTVESALWKSVQKARTPKGLSNTTHQSAVTLTGKSKRSDPKNLNIATRGKFAIIGEDDSDEDIEAVPPPLPSNAGSAIDNNLPSAGEDS